VSGGLRVACRSLGRSGGEEAASSVLVAGDVDDHNKRPVDVLGDFVERVSDRD
jgi:hypothetical protein